MIPQPAAGASPTLPGSMGGNPTAPGASPAAAPGGGAGNSEAAIAMLKSIVPTLHKLMMAFPFGSKEYSAVSRALTALTPIAGKVEEDSLVPAAVRQMAMNAQGGPLRSAPPVGLSPAAPPTGA